MLAAIWAEDENGLIGSENRMPWHLPDDLRFFKNMTQNNAVVMGRNTFEGLNKKALPERINLILTSDLDYTAEGVTVVHSIAEIKEFADRFEGITFIAGGSEVYRQFLPDVSILYRTKVYKSFSGDTFFPEINWQEWTMINQSEGTVDENNPYPHTFETYQRISE